MNKRKTRIAHTLAQFCNLINKSDIKNEDFF